MAKTTDKPEVPVVEENTPLSKAALEQKRKDAQEKFEKISSDLEKKERDWVEFRNGVQQELFKLQGEFRLLTSLIDA